jgi:hypothetical protein
MKISDAEVLYKEKLEKLYYAHPNKVVCGMLGITPATLYNHLRRFKIKFKGYKGLKRIPIINEKKIR